MDLQQSVINCPAIHGINPALSMYVAFHIECILLKVHISLPAHFIPFQMILYVDVVLVLYHNTLKLNSVFKTASLNVLFI